MSYVPTEHATRQRRLRGLGAEPMASTFSWTPDGWYYVYSWTEGSGWDGGGWVLGENLCSYFDQSVAAAGWHVVFDAAGALVLSDSHPNTRQAGCFQVAGLSGALGYDFTMTLPIVGKETISLPVEKLISDAVPLLINAAWPPLQAKIEAEVPSLLQKATTALEAEVPKLITQGESALLNTVWPSLEPKLLADMQIGIDEAKKTVWLATGMIVLAVAGSAWWLTKKSKPKAA